MVTEGLSAVSLSTQYSVLRTVASWTLILDGVGRPGWANMAIDQALLDLAEREGRAFLRLYRWTPHCLSFGRNEPALRRYAPDQILALRLDTVRRPTGGRAVWHARELTYAVAAPATCFGSLAESYRRIHEMMAEAVRRLGAPATLAAAPAHSPGLHGGACFAQPAGGEVVAAGRKVVGSAQLRQGTAFLQHGSLLLEDSQDIVGQVSRGAWGKGADAPLASLLGRSVAFPEAARAVIESARSWTGDWRAQELTPELEAATEPHYARFRSAEWTWRR